MTRRRRQVFAWSLGGWLIAPFIPIEFTSVITATVWSISGGGYAFVFAILGTFFRLDSVTVYSGVQEILVKMIGFPNGLVAAYATVVVMLIANLLSAYVFKAILQNQILGRLPVSYRAPSVKLPIPMAVLRTLVPGSWPSLLASLRRKVFE